MLNFKRLVFVSFALLLAACSMDTESPIFMTLDSDYIGSIMKIDGVLEKGKPAEGYLTPHPSSDGSYYIATNFPPKYDDRYIFKAIKQISDGIIFAVQVSTAPRPMWNGHETKPRYEVYPVKITASGAITIYELLHNEKVLKIAKKHHVEITPNSISLQLSDGFDRQSVQCLIQELINKDLYELMNEKKSGVVSLVGYQAPTDIGIPGCR